MGSSFFKTTLRSLWKNKGFSFLNLFGLATGVACAALIFLWVESEVLYDHNNTKRDRLYLILENQAYDGKTYTYSATPGLMGPAVKREIPGVANTCRITWDKIFLFTLGEKALYQTGFYSDSSLLSMFTIPFVEGLPEHAFDQLHSLVISQRMAKRFFGTDRHVVGKTLKVNNDQDYTVTGVVQDFPENASIRFDWIAPFEVFYNENKWLEDWGSNGIKTYVELQASTDPLSVNRLLNGFIQKRAKDAVASPFIFPMNDWHLRFSFTEGKQTGGQIEFVRMFVIIAWIILAIACINFMNLATARSEKRAREVGVRKVLGARKRALVAQFMGEALLMSALAALLAIGLARLCLPRFNTLVERSLHLDLLSPSHLMALLVIALACGVFAGSYPALYLSRFNPIFVFKGMKMKSGGAAVIRKGLVVLQFTISITLIISTVIVYQQLVHVKNRDLGYNKDRLVQVDVQGNMINHFDAIRQDLLKSGQIQEAALSSLNMIYMGSNSDDFTWEGKDPKSKILITEDRVSPQYLSTTKTRLIAGRDFESRADSSSIIINQSLAALMGKGPVVGRIITRDTSKFTIVGVVGSFVYGDMYGKADPLIFFCNTHYASYLYIRVLPQGDPHTALADIEKVLKAYNPEYPFDYRFVDDQFNEQFKSEALVGKLSRIFAMLAIVISCLGLFGLAAYTSERRTKEIGIRRVLGASASAVVRLLNREFLVLVAVASVIAFPLAWITMWRWLQNYAYRISIDWWVFVIAALAAVLIALVTVSFQALRAAVANPVTSLRIE